MLLKPLTYHLRMRDFLKSGHAELWEWFASSEASANYKAAVELQLLKTTYRMDPGSHPELYTLADEALNTLGLETPVTLYQAQDTGQNSAAIYYTPGHAQIVFGGGILKLLDRDERLALLGHELAHFNLWTTGDGDFLIADRLLNSLANEPRASPGHLESARLWQLYTEVYADRGAATMTPGPNAAVSTLVKVSTGSDEADAASYIRQAADIFAAEAPTTAGVTHPETFIRARAIDLWANRGPDTSTTRDADDEIHRMIEGTPSFDHLDLLAQDALTKKTRRLLRHHLAPQWLRTPHVRAHAAHFIDEHGLVGPAVPLEEIQADWRNADDKTRDYACYLLLDFAAADAELDEHGLAASFVTAGQLGWADRFEEFARKELKLKKSTTSNVRKNAEKLVAEAAAQTPQDDA